MKDSPSVSTENSRMTAAIAEHLRTRREYCRVLLDLSRRQQALIAERDFTELMAVIGRKQRVLGRLDALKQQHPTLVADWKAQRDQLPKPLRKLCDELLQETEGILAELIAEEKSCTDELSRQRDETARQLAETADGQTAHRAYGTGEPAHDHRYLDINQ